MIIRSYMSNRLFFYWLYIGYFQLIKQFCCHNFVTGVGQPRTITMPGTPRPVHQAAISGTQQKYVIVASRPPPSPSPSPVSYVVGISNQLQ